MSRHFNRAELMLDQGYDASNPDCQPEIVGHSTWSKDRFSGYGSYTNFQVSLMRVDLAHC